MVRSKVGSRLWEIHTSFVQLPEFVGWKKPSVEAINFANESRALHPARYVLALRWPPFPSGADR